MKKMYRYMNIKELEKLTSGSELVHTGHFNARTDSGGMIPRAFLKCRGTILIKLLKEGKKR